MDNKVDNSGSGKVDQLISAVGTLTKQVNRLKSELREIKNEKRGDKYYSGSKYLCRVFLRITRIIVTIVINVGHQVI